MILFCSSRVSRLGPAAHEEAVWACGILNVLDRRYKLLLWGRGPSVRNRGRLGQRLHQRDMVKLVEPLVGHEMEFEELLPAADACLLRRRGGGDVTDRNVHGGGDAQIVSR